MSDSFIVSLGDDGRVWVSNDDWSVVKGVDGVWRRSAPSAYDLKDNFERADSKSAAAFLKEATAAVSSNPNLLRKAIPKDNQMGKAGKPKYQVFTDDNFHYMDESERIDGNSYDTHEEAVVEARRSVDRSLRWERLQSKDPNDPDELYDRYQDFGDDPFVRPGDPDRHFYAWG